MAWQHRSRWLRIASFPSHSRGESWVAWQSVVAVPADRRRATTDDRARKRTSEQTGERLFVLPPPPLPPPSISIASTTNRDAVDQTSEAKRRKLGEGQRRSADGRTGASPLLYVTLSRLRSLHSFVLSLPIQSIHVSFFIKQYRHTTYTVSWLILVFSIRFFRHRGSLSSSTCPPNLPP